MMTISSFLKLVEIRTKVASIIPFLLGTVYTIYYFNNFRWSNFTLLFISLICFDMLTTLLNNYMDYRDAQKTEGYNYEVHNAIVSDDLTETAVSITIFILLAVAILSGILLYLNTSVFVLLLGMLSFAAGVAYSLGPLPISRTPFGEIISGIFMGFVITFVSIYIHVYDQGLITLAYQSAVLKITLNLKQIIYIVLVSLPAVMGIANIMLANNICDIADDLENKRYTLPVYIGKERALTVFKILYYITYFDFIYLAIFKITPLITILSCLSLLPVYKNIQRFTEQQTKKDTFVLAVKNFVLINITYIFTISLAIIFKDF